MTILVLLSVLSLIMIQSILGVGILIFGVPIDTNKIFGIIGIICFGILFIRSEGNKKIIK